MIIFISNLAVPRAAGLLSRGQNHSSDISHCGVCFIFFSFLTRRPREHRNEIGSLSPTECLVGFELDSFRYFLTSFAQ